jgi:hypothetical protein
MYLCGRCAGDVDIVMCVTTLVSVFLNGGTGFFSGRTALLTIASGKCMSIGDGERRVQRVDMTGVIVSVSVLDAARLIADLRSVVV